VAISLWRTVWPSVLEFLRQRLIEYEVRHWLGLSGIELRCLIEEKISLGGPRAGESGGGRWCRSRCRSRGLGVARSRPNRVRTGRLSLWTFDLRPLTYPSLLVIDEIGYLPVTQTGAMLFFQHINRRYISSWSRSRC
jgi:IstB-like ATP binding protein